ncbi:phosphoribosyl pyrophosphokinase [Lichtheimia hyalospora FSU 10163]|nr:phosphoribosyl pyrophosphokinase [Lichtheimia hyalospora FSU 10163]
MVVLSGSSHPRLTENICQQLSCHPAKSCLTKSSNNETRFELHEEDVREKCVFVVQSGSSQDHQVNDYLMEMLTMIHTCKAAAAKKVIAVLPFFPYSRQPNNRFARAGTLVANLLMCAGVDHIITLDLHDPQFQGFFDCPFVNLSAKPIITKNIQKHITNHEEAVIVSPDAGGAKRAIAIADHLDMDFALIHETRAIMGKQRKHNFLLVGDVKDRVCVIIDDIIDTASTITKAARMLHENGATQIYAVVTHAVFSGDALDRIEHSYLDRVIVSDSIHQHQYTISCDKITTFSIGPLLAESIRRIHYGESVSVLFDSAYELF